MSGTRVIITYKRKRLSSCSGVSDGTVSQESPDEAQCGKHNCSSKEHTSETQESDPTVHHQSMNSSSCSKESKLVAVSCVEGPDMKQNEIDFHQLPPTKVCSETASELTTENLSSGMLQQKCTNAIHEAHIDDDSVYQSVEKSYDSIENLGSLSKENAVTTRSTTPLLTFNRRSKRKRDTVKADVFNKRLSNVEVEAAKKRKPICLPASSCEASSHHDGATDQPIEFKPESHGIETNDMLAESGEKGTSSRCNCIPSSPAGAYSVTESLRWPLEIKSIDKNAGTGTSPVDKSASYEGLVSSFSACHETIATDVPPKDCHGCSSENVLPFSSTGDAGTGELPLVCGCQTPTRVESEHNRSAESNCNIATGKIAEFKCSQNSFNSTVLKPDAWEIDCNITPLLDSGEGRTVGAVEAPRDSDSIARIDAGILQQASISGEALESFGTRGEHLKDAQSSYQTKLQKCTEKYYAAVNGRDHERPSDLDMNLTSENKCLQLFSEDRSNGMFPSTSAQSLTATNGVISQATEMNNFSSSSVRTSLYLDLSLQTEGGTASHIPSSQSSILGEFKQTSAIDSLSNDVSSTLRRRMLLDSFNHHQTPVGMSSSPSARFDDRNLWSDDELDFLWIGVRRYGKGNWDAMLLDSRLCFSPWRTARHLADRWELEQYKLLNGSCMPLNTNSRPVGAYFDSKCHLFPPRSRIQREMVSAEPQLSLGDVYSQKEAGCLTTNVLNNGIRQAHRPVRSTKWSSNSSCQVGNYACDLFNVDRVLLRSDASNLGSLAGLSGSSHAPHLQGEGSLPTLRPPELLPPISALRSHTETLKLVQSWAPSETSRLMRNAFDDSFGGGALMTGDPRPSSGAPVARAPLKKGEASKSNCAYSGPANKPHDLVVLDSDGSSEETVSDEHHERS